MSKSNMCSTSPTEFDALIVYFPKWTAWFILGIIKLLDDVLGSVSNLTLSFNVNSLPFNNHDILALGKASTKHSNLMVWSWTTTVFLGTLINLGAPLY